MRMDGNSNKTTGKYDKKIFVFVLKGALPLIPFKFKFLTRNRLVSLALEIMASNVIFVTSAVQTLISSGKEGVMEKRNLQPKLEI